MKNIANTTDIAAASAALLNATVATTKTLLPTAPAEKKDVSRANWTGVLKFGQLPIKVKTFKATEEEKVSFNRVVVVNPEAVEEGAAPRYARLKQGAMTSEELGRPVDPTEILSGYEFAKDEYVVVSEEEKKMCKVASEKDMTISSFVSMEEVDPILFSDAEYLAPEKGFEGMHQLLVDAMLRTGKVAIAQSNQRGRTQTLVLRPYGQHGIVAHYMFFDNEVRSCDKFPTVTSNPDQVEFAAKLIEVMTDTFDITEYNDPYTRNLKGIVNEKILGNEIVQPEPILDPVADNKVDVIALLAASFALPTERKAKKAMAATAA